MLTTTPISRKERRRAAKVDNILEAALGLLVDEGLDGLTVGRLAKALDITAGALYRYFESKDAILAALQVRIIGDLNDQFGAVWGWLDSRDQPVAPLVYVQAAADTFLFLAGDEPERFRLLSLVLAEPDPLVDDQTFDAIMHPARTVLALAGQRLDDCVAAGILEPGLGLMRAIVLWGGLQSVAQMNKLARVGDAAFQRGPLAVELVTTLLRGWGASAEEVGAARVSANDIPFATLLGSSARSSGGTP